MQYRILKRFSDLDMMGTKYDLNDIVYFDDERAEKYKLLGFIEEYEAQLPFKDGNEVEY